MGALSIYARNKLLDHIYKTAYTPPATIYLALYVGDPEDSGSEASGNNYARASITFGAASSRRVTQNALVTFPQSSGAWGGTITHYGIHDASANGNMLGSGTFNSSFAVVSGNTPKVASGQCYLEISATSAGAGLTTATVNNLLNLMFRNVAYPSPKDSLHIAMSNSVIDDSDSTYSDITEESGAGYTRTSLPSTSMDYSVSGAITNNSGISLASPTASDWIAVVALAIMDASTSGNIIAYDSANVVDQTPANGDTIEIATGSLDHALT